MSVFRNPNRGTFEKTKANAIVFPIATKSGKGPERVRRWTGDEIDKWMHCLNNRVKARRE